MWIICEQQKWLKMREGANKVPIVDYQIEAQIQKRESPTVKRQKDCFSAKKYGRILARSSSPAHFGLD
ncbi:hypothetical protein RB195_014112 [Necator americanus]|uniref:Uncharacterized protein n=1 Tax=Necator americanus TaxID=51031 RepID=A0ABR1DZ14_NECAM